MKLILRLLWLILTRRRRATCSALGPCETPFRVLPNDLDIFMHVNNGVYLTIADLGRTDMLLRAGLTGELRQRGWYPVVAAETIRFRCSLELWQRFTITTRVVGWNTRSVYLEQRFESRGELVAQMAVDARFLSRRGGRVDMPELLDAFGIEVESPELPNWVARWTEVVELHAQDKPVTSNGPLQP